MALACLALITAQIFSGCKKEKKVDGIDGASGSDTLGQSTVLWGVTTTGGSIDSGMIFKIRGDGSGFDSFYSFTAADGLAPSCTLCKAENGKLYGTASLGGLLREGTLFCFDPTKKTFKKIVDFDLLTNGFIPVNCHLVLANNGKIYGASSLYLFCIDPASDNFTVVYKDSVGVVSNITSGEGNYLYGTVEASTSSSYNYNLLFRFDVTNNKVEYLANIGAEDGYLHRQMSLASDGNLYGTTLKGGAADGGVLFKFSLSDKKYTKLQEFNGLNGASATYDCHLVESGGKLYGITSAGGTYGAGIFFSYSLASGVYNVERFFGKDSDSLFLLKGISLSRSNIIYLNGGGIDGDAVVRFNPADKSYKYIFTFPNRHPRYTSMNASLAEY